MGHVLAFITAQLWCEAHAKVPAVRCALPSGRLGKPWVTACCWAHPSRLLQARFGEDFCNFLTQQHDYKKINADQWVK